MEFGGETVEVRWLVEHDCGDGVGEGGGEELGRGDGFSDVGAGAGFFNGGVDFAVHEIAEVEAREGDLRGVPE